MNEAGLRADSGWGNHAAVISPGESNFILERFGRGCAEAAFRGAAGFAVASTGAAAFATAFGAAVFFELAFAAGACFAAFRGSGFWIAFFGAVFFGAAFFGAAFFGAAFFGAAFFGAAFFGVFLAGAFFAAGREADFPAFNARFAGAFPFAGFAFAAGRFPAAGFLEEGAAFAAFRAGAFFPPPFFPAEGDFVPLGVGFLDAGLFFGTVLPFTDFFLEAAVALRPAFFPFAAGIKELRSVMKTRGKRGAQYTNHYR